MRASWECWRQRRQKSFECADWDYATSKKSGIERHCHCRTRQKKTFSNGWLRCWWLEATWLRCSQKYIIAKPNWHSSSEEALMFVLHQKSFHRISWGHVPLSCFDRQWPLKKEQKPIKAAHQLLKWFEHSSYKFLSRCHHFLFHILSLNIWLKHSICIDLMKNAIQVF